MTSFPSDEALQAAAWAWGTWDTHGPPWLRPLLDAAYQVDEPKIRADERARIDATQARAEIDKKLLG